MCVSRNVSRGPKYKIKFIYKVIHLKMLHKILDIYKKSFEGAHTLSPILDPPLSITVVSRGTIVYLLIYH